MKETVTKLKMSMKRFMAIMIPLIVLIVGLIIAVTAVMNYWKVVMNQTFGYPEIIVKDLEGTENWNADYYGKQSGGKTKADENAAAVAEEAEKEGIVLLKNKDNALPLTDVGASSRKTVNAFGWSFYYPVNGGGGSGSIGSEGIVTPEDCLKEVGIDINQTLKAEYHTWSEENKTKWGNKDNADAARPNITSVAFGSAVSWDIPEMNASDIAEATQSGTSTDSIVWIGRSGGEFTDAPRAMDEHGSVLAGDAFGYDSSKHYLELTDNEKAVIARAKELAGSDGKVIVVLNTNAAMELGELAYDDGIDAIMWVGAPGKSGYHAIGKTIVGTYNPSGRLPDIYAADFLKDPTVANFSDPEFYKGSSESAAPVTRYTTELKYGDDKTRHAYFVGYEEGIYVGYRYYETAASVSGYYSDDNIPEEKNGDAYYNLTDGVVYPFGYGLSYTTFDQKIEGSYSASDETFTFNVTVENTGERAGKDVIEIYVEAPYTAGGIEKSKVTLAAFAKTPELTTDGEGSTYTTTIKVKAEDIASYDMSEGGRYVIDAGEYNFYLGTAGGVNYGSHSWAYADDDSKVTLNVGEIVYDGDNKRDSDSVAAANLFDDVMSENNLSTADGSEVMSRSKMKASFPTAPTQEDRTMSDALKNSLDSNLFDSKEDVQKHNDSSDVMPVTGAENGLSLINLRGKDYDDEAWKYYIEQFRIDELKLLISRAGFQTEAVTRLGKPQTNDNDGPQALKYQALGTDTVATYLCALPCEVVLAATWNTELLRRVGQAVGEEGLQYGVSGWYAPGLNLHRSPFGGRNFEYFSEDPLLAGKLCAAEISGAADKGLYCYVKHFVLNDQEAWARQYNSGDWGTTDCVLLTWANEQTMRELYFKAFEIAFKEAVTEIKYLDENGEIHSKEMRAATAVMTSFNFIGNTWTGGCYQLLTELLRGEWGFEGFVLTDYTLHDYMYADQMLRAGGDACLQSNARTIRDTESATAVKCMQAAVKNMCFTVVHSNVMTDIKPGSSISYTLAPWAVGLLIANIVIYLAAIGGVVWIVLRAIDSRKNPDKYKH